MTPLAVREPSGKRKRARTSEEDCAESKATKTKCEEENVCPNGGVQKNTPTRKARGLAKGGKKLLGGTGDAAKMEGTGQRDDVSFGPIPKAQPGGSKHSVLHFKSSLSPLCS